MIVFLVLSVFGSKNQTRLKLGWAENPQKFYQIDIYNALSVRRYRPWIHSMANKSNHDLQQVSKVSKLKISSNLTS